MDVNNYSHRYYFRCVIVALALVNLFFLSCTVPNRNSNSSSISHDLWTEVLQEIVEDNGRVNYLKLKENPEKFHRYLSFLENNHPDPNTWSKEERLAFWINAYNAFTVKLIIDNYPLESIKDLNSSISIPFVNTIWDKSFIKINEFKYSLNDIEHRILRKKFQEPRIHFAINCASVSCPDLKNEAYISEKLDEQLEFQAKAFINDKSKNLISKEQIKVSKLFSWFGGDFKNEGSLINFLNKFSNTQISENTDVSFMDYDWSLIE